MHSNLATTSSPQTAPTPISTHVHPSPSAQHDGPSSYSASKGKGRRVSSSTSSSWKKPSPLLSEGSSRKEGFGPTLIHQLPTEALSHVFAHMSPTTLALAQLVCKHWRQIIQDEASWRTAYETNFGILTGGEGAKPSLGRRLSTASWRAEYISRVKLLSRWKKSRVATITHDPQIGPLTSFVLTSTPTPRILSLSLSFGRAITSEPFLGKVSKRSLAATPTTVTGQAMNPNLPLLQTTAVAASPDGSKLIWGMQDGSVRYIDSSTPVTASGRAWHDDRVRSLAGGAHLGPVKAVQFASAPGVGAGEGAIFATVGLQGDVAVWFSPSRFESGPQGRRDAPPARKIWQSLMAVVALPAAVRGAMPQGVTSFAFAIEKKSATPFSAVRRVAQIALGISTGAVLVWKDVEIDTEVEAAVVSTAEPIRLSEARKACGGVEKLEFDLEAEALFVHLETAKCFSRYSLNSAHSPIEFGHLPDHVGDLTAFAFDFAPPPALPITSTPGNATPSRSIFVDSSLLSLTSDSPSLPDLTSLAPTGMNAFGRTKYVAAGDAEGRVFLWDWEAAPVSPSELVMPTRMIQGFETKVTALELTDFGVFVGGLDGALRVYDTLTSSLLRTFKDRAASRGPARLIAAGLIDDEARWRVGAIQASRETVVAAIGVRILAWRVADELSKKKKHASLGGKAASGVGKMSARTERYRSEQELRQEVKESLSTLSSESQTRLAKIKHDRHIAQEYGLPPSLDNMTEEEAVAFALMLSVDDQEAQWLDGFGGRGSSRSSPAFDPVPEHDMLDMDGLSLDDVDPRPTPPRHSSSYRLEADDSDSDAETESLPSQSSSYSRSLSVPSSPFLRGGSLGPSTSNSSSPARSWNPAWRPATSSSPSPGSYRVNVSPRLGPTYGSSASQSPLVVVPDMSLDSWPAMGAKTAGGIESLPSPVLPPTTPSPVVKRGWSDVARSTSGSPSPSPSFGRTAPAPTTPSSSLLAATLGRAGSAYPTQGGSPSPSGSRRVQSIEEREEEELRFALELSLAEEASRKEQ